MLISAMCSVLCLGELGKAAQALRGCQAPSMAWPTSQLLSLVLSLEHQDFLPCSWRPHPVACLRLVIPLAPAGE